MKMLAAILFAGAALGVSAQQVMPPWSEGHNDPVADKGFVFHVPDMDNVPDLHGDPIDAKLVLFIGGNQFFVLPRLIAGFEKLHPELAGHIFYETLPPGVLLQQIEANNTVTLGNLTLHIVPDVYEAGSNALEAMMSAGKVTHAVNYVSNDLQIMVPAGNPRHITSLKDLAKPGLRVALPNPAFEGIGKQVQAALSKAGGETLTTEIYKTRVASGENTLTQIHHRQTPIRILTGQSDAGVVWTSEVLFQKKIGNPIEGVAIPAEQNTPAMYAVGVMTNTLHREAALAWLAYLQSDEAQAAYHEFGFKTVPPAKPR
jgi:molybdenum ABC transporter molybdate-binding protein